MGIIVPAIIPTSFQDLEEKIEALRDITDEVQVDIVDGDYAGPASWPYRDDDRAAPSRMLAEGKLLPRVGEFKFEVDLMARDVESTSGVWIELGAARIIIHAESTPYLKRFFANARAVYGHDKDFAPGILSIGIALGAATDLALIEPYIESVDFVQFMGVRTIGRQGEPFDMSTVARVRAFHKKYPNIPVQVDGGVTLESAPALLDAGASRLVVGSALWKQPNLKDAYAAFEALTEQHGLYT